MRVKLLISGVLFAVFCFSSLSYSGVPQMINYQGKITTPAGVLVDTTVQMIFTIYDAAVDGGVLWADTQFAVVVEKGVFSVLLGSGNPVPDSVFDGNVRYLGVKVGDDPEMTPRKSIVSVGYAYKSEHADTAEYAFSATTDNDWDMDTLGINIYRLTGNVGIGSAIPPQYKLDVGGAVQMTGFRMPTGASNGFVLASDGSGVGTWQAVSGIQDNHWTFRITDGNDTTLTTGGQWGIARSGNVLYGNADSTHVNLGVGCTTGTSGQNWKYCSVGGGYCNTASWDYATVGGGLGNIANYEAAAVGGGKANTASSDMATVAGGYYNTASGTFSTVAGGLNNTAEGPHGTVGGGCCNVVSIDHATVGGGWENTANGVAATVPGGRSNTGSGDYSFAAGYSVNVFDSADYTFAFGNNFATSTSHAVIFYDADTETKVGIQTTGPTARLDVNSSTGYNQIRMRTSYTPTGTSDTNGNVGDIVWDDNYFYVKTSAGWKRVVLSTW